MSKSFRGRETRSQATHQQVIVVLLELAHFCRIGCTGSRGSGSGRFGLQQFDLATDLLKLLVRAFPGSGFRFGLADPLRHLRLELQRMGQLRVRYGWYAESVHLFDCTLVMLALSGVRAVFALERADGLLVCTDVCLMQRELFLDRSL